MVLRLIIKALACPSHIVRLTVALLFSLIVTPTIYAMLRGDEVRR
jgi:hypothetical protein